MFKFSFILFILFNTLSYSATFNVSTTSELETALSTSTNNNEDDTVILSDGTYSIINPLEYSVRDGFDITLEGSHADNVILDGNNASSIIKMGTSGRIIINNISFINGRSNVAGTPGAIYINNAEINGCIFKNNRVTASGTFAYGGAIIGYNLIINNSVFTSNGTSVNYSVGGYISGTHKVVGGSIYSTSGYLYINNSEFTSNMALCRGGAIYSENRELVLSNCTFTRNRTTLSGKSSSAPYQVYGGGAVRTQADTTLIFGCIFSENNSADSTSNVSYGASDAIYADNQIHIANSIFSKHDKAIYISDNAYVVNSIFYKNLTHDFFADDYAGLTLYNNFINLTKSYMKTSNSDFINNVYNDFELGFVDANNDDYRLTDKSNLINTGVNTVPEYDIPTLDMDGNPRLIGSSMDMGPYEYQTDIVSYGDMTYDEKLVEAIKPEYYDDLVALIESEKNAAVADAVVGLTQWDIDALPSGWHNIANPTQITDMSIFVNVQTVWVYKDGIWSAYSPNTNISTALTEASISKLTSIDANSAMWIER